MPGTQTSCASASTAEPASDRSPVVMDEGSAADLCRAFDRAGVRCWVVGGWGVDALLGRCTRPHKDLDVLLAVTEHADAWRLLHDRGYRLAYRWEENVDVPGASRPTSPCSGSS